MVVYTKKGDAGETRLIDGSKVEKSSCQSVAVGELDALNCEIGSILCFRSEKFKNSRNNERKIFYDKQMEILENIQTRIFEISSIIANPKYSTRTDVVFNPDHIKLLEDNIDSMEKMMPKIRNFILPQGNQQMMTAHRARVICRSTERNLTGLINSSGNNFIKINCSAYINRLSDYLFTLVRYIGFYENIPERKIVSHKEFQAEIEPVESQINRDIAEATRRLLSDLV